MLMIIIIILGKIIYHHHHCFGRQVSQSCQKTKNIVKHESDSSASYSQSTGNITEELTAEDGRAGSLEKNQDLMHKH